MTYKLKLPSHWKIHNAFRVSLLKNFQGTPPTDPIHEDTPKFNEVEGVLQSKIIIQHQDNLLQSDKVLHKYPVKFKKYPFDDVQWMIKYQLKDYVLLVIKTYKNTHGLDDERDKDIDVYTRINENL